MDWTAFREGASEMKAKDKDKPLYAVTEDAEPTKFYTIFNEANEDYHSRYRNGSRDIVEYLPCDIRKVRKAISDLRAVLLDPDGYGSIEGSDEDNEIIENAMEVLSGLSDPQSGGAK